MSKIAASISSPDISPPLAEDLARRLIRPARSFDRPSGILTTRMADGGVTELARSDGRSDSARSQKGQVRFRASLRR